MYRQKFFRKYLLLLIAILFFSCDWNRSVVLSSDDGLRSMQSKQDFDSLSSAINVPGAFNQQEVKFVVMDVQKKDPVIFFINSNKYEDHYSFIKEALGADLSMADFKSEAYFKASGRSYLVGELIFYEHYFKNEIDGLYTVAFWPSDAVPFENIKLCYDLILQKSSFLKGCLKYHPSGVIQETYFKENKLEQKMVPYVFSDELFAQFDFIPFNKGESYGILRLAQKSQYDIADIVFFKSIPNTLSHVSGIITEIPQTPLCHINLIARQNSIPNAFIREPLQNNSIKSLENKYVHFVVSDDGYVLEESTEAAVNAYLEQYRPKKTQLPNINLTVTEIKALSDIGFSDAHIYGSKAANVAELAKILPYEIVPHGHAVPFYYYDKFMRDNGFYETAVQMMNNSEFKNDIEYRKDELKKFRKLIEAGTVDSGTEAEFQKIWDSYSIPTNLRCRSSTNSEDLQGFSGAGLYESCTHKPKEGNLSKSIKEVWAGAWTFRAFQEREFYRIDHLSACMAVLIHPNYKNELSNGVAVTKNIYDINYRGFYVNVQVEEDMVTNPDAESIPEEFLISVKGSGNSYETEYIRYSNRVPDGFKVLSADHIKELTRYMELIQDHFIKKYDAVHNNNFAMEIEFKVTSAGILAIKQARPW